MTFPRMDPSTADAPAAPLANEWDQTSFDPDHPTKPLSHFEPMVRQACATPHSR